MTSGVTAQLILIQGDRQHFQRVIPLSNTNVSIGRAQNCNVVWGSSQISRQHASLDYVNSKWFILDTSTKSISVNGKQLMKGELFPLNDLDIISFLPTGTVRYRLKYASSSVSAPHRPSASLWQNNNLMSPLPAFPSTSTSRSYVNAAASSSRNWSVENREDSLDSGRRQTDRKKKEIIVISSEDESSKDDDDSTKAELPTTTSTFKFRHSPEPEFTLMSDEQVNKCNNIEKLKAQLGVIKTDRNIEREEFRKKEKEAESSNAVFKEETYKKLLELMESELSCSVCNEIFIQATVIECGHTFCGFCIAEWSRTKQECPMCRKRFTSRCRHIQIENFIIKMFESFNEEIASNRQASILDRETQVKRAEEEAAHAQTAHQNRGLDEINERIVLPPRPRGPPYYARRGGAAGTARRGGAAGSDRRQSARTQERVVGNGVAPAGERRTGSPGPGPRLAVCSRGRRNGARPN